MLLDLFFPRTCRGCQTTGTWLCTSCASLMRTHDQQCCYVCYHPSENGNTCTSCLISDRVLNGIIVAAHYDGNPLLKHIIHSLKYENRPDDIVPHLGKLLHSSLSSLSSFHSPHFIPIPLHPSRLKKRGYNQTSLLTHELNNLFDHNIKIDEDILIRSKITASQVEVSSKQERLKNLEGAFEVTKKINPNTTYILIDDVCTTGSTLEECCETLKKAGAKQVWGLVLARN